MLQVTDLRTEVGRWNLETAGMLVFDKRLGCLESASAGEEFGHRMVEANNIVFKLAGELKLSFPLYRVGLFQFDNKEAFPRFFSIYSTQRV